MRFLPILMLAACATTTGSTGHPQEGRLAPNAPKDVPVQFVVRQDDADPESKWRQLTAVPVAQARASYPDAKRRYLAGLPKGETFFVTTVLRDPDRHFEQVFIRVSHIADNVVAGSVASQILGVHGYREHQAVAFPEGEVVDWTISKPDGSEEGNVVGKFLESLPPSPPR